MIRNAAHATSPSIALDGPMLSRKCACGAGKTGSAGECDGCSRKLHRRARPGATAHEVPNSVDGVLRSAGEPLGGATLHDMESRFGRSFAHVRLHRDGDAAASAESVNALAYTVGHHVVFGAAQYAPHTASGRRLLAHELAHVAQQTHGESRAATGATQLAPPAAERAIEADADRVADAALRSERGVPVDPAVRGALVLARQAAPSAAPGSAPAAQPANACTGAANVTQVNMGRTPGARFDATLDRSTCPACSLVLTMRVLFNQANTWPDASSWNRFQADYVRLVQDRWGHVYDFVPPAAGCAGEGCQRVSVGLNVVPVAAAGSPHWTINVTHTNQFIRSFVSSGAHTATLDSQDTAQDGGQVAVEHEAGHMLGFGHTNCGLNGAYTGNINATTCYGGDIMGAGSEVTVPEYQVFSETLTALAPGCGWRPAITDARRSRNRTTGTIVGGILGGLAGAGLGIAAGYGIASALGGDGIIGGVIGGAVGLVAGAVGGAFAGSAIGDSSRRTGEV